MRSPPASRIAGRRAWSMVAPPPTVFRPAACAAESVSRNASRPKSRLWLLATVTRSMPATLGGAAQQARPAAEVVLLVRRRHAAVRDRALEVHGGDVGRAEHARDAGPRIRLAVALDRLAHALAGRHVAGGREQHRPHDQPSRADARALARDLDERAARGAHRPRQLEPPHRAGAGADDAPPVDDERHAPRRPGPAGHAERRTRREPRGQRAVEADRVLRHVPDGHERAAGPRVAPAAGREHAEATPPRKTAAQASQAEARRRARSSRTM